MQQYLVRQAQRGYFPKKIKCDWHGMQRSLCRGESVDYLKVYGRLEGFTYFKGKLADVLQEGWE